MASSQIYMPMAAAAGHGSHPSIPHLILLVFEAIFEVVCTGLPGFILARMGRFPPEAQKVLGDMNMWLFTPCLIFSKLASKLSLDKMRELWIIPVIWAVQVLVSWFLADGVSRLMGLRRRPRRFVTAMAVFGNSNSLPISLVVSLSHTISGLHWKALPSDSNGAVAGRGILYLLLYQQLGQFVRWTWGANTLLKPKSEYPEYSDEVVEEGGAAAQQGSPTEGADGFDSAGQTPVAGTSQNTPAGSDDEADGHPKKRAATLKRTINKQLARPKHFLGTVKAVWTKKVDPVKASMGRARHRAYERLPRPLQRAADRAEKACAETGKALKKSMNPPLWAMLVAVLVASVPRLQELFFGKGFVNNSVTTAVHGMGSVAVPLILVVLGGNLGTKTEEIKNHDAEEDALGWRLLVPSLVCRMVLTPLVMGPAVAVFVKHVRLNIVGDPIFVVVNYLLLGAPPALQLAQICQDKAVFERTMAKISFHSYVIWVLPSTMVLVMGALEVIEWTAR